MSPLARPRIAFPVLPRFQYQACGGGPTAGADAVPPSGPGLCSTVVLPVRMSVPAPETISDNCVVIFSKTSCSYCAMAKKLFHDINVKYKVVELDMLEYGSQFQDALYKMTGEKTVPRIFINGTFIGGATDTHRLHKEGKLLPLVHQCYLKKNSSPQTPNPGHRLSAQKPREEEEEEEE
ncbi:hypothetical protein GH733_010572 [Mirounga leonina]|nr:hypothetical protein GH733_010572 [Mirounga leonina]